MGWLIVVVLLLVGCATVPPEPMAPPPLPLLQEPPPVVEQTPQLPAEDRSRLLDSEPHWPTENPVQVAAKAAKRATLMPASVGFNRGMLVYPYYPYAVYRVDVPIGGSLHVQLQRGEEIRLVDGLRDVHWRIQRDDARSALEESHLSVTPQEANVHGRMTLITAHGLEQRVYYLDVHSHETHGLYGVSWRHPGKSIR